MLKRIRNATFRTKILLLLSSLIVAMGLSVLVAMNLNRHALFLLSDSYNSNAELNSFVQDVSLTESAMETYVNYRTFESIDAYYNCSARVENFRQTMQQNPSTDEISQKEYVVNQLALSFLYLSRKAVTARRANDSDDAAAYYARSAECYNFLVRQVSELNMLFLTHNAHVYEKDRANVTGVTRMSFVFLVALFFVILMIAYLLITRMTDPLESISEVATRVARHDFDVPLFNRDTQDEIGNICRAFDRMIISIREYVDTIWEKARTENKLRESEMEMRALYADAQLRALQSQINPHFLFNTLNTGVQLAMMENADRTCFFLEQVSDFFRYNIQQQKQVATIEDELSLVDSFVYIMKVRFGQRLEFKKNTPDGPCYEQLPSMTLQPLVENCIKHGLRNETGKVELTIRREESFVVISVSDNGEGFDPSIRARVLEAVKNEDVGSLHELSLPEGSSSASDKSTDPTEHVQHTGTGLINVFMRLKLYFHRDDIFDIDTSADSGTQFIIRIPKNV